MFFLAIRIRYVRKLYSFLNNITPSWVKNVILLLNVFQSGRFLGPMLYFKKKMVDGVKFPGAFFAGTTPQYFVFVRWLLQTTESASQVNDETTTTTKSFTESRQQQQQTQQQQQRQQRQRVTGTCGHVMLCTRGRGEEGRWCNSPWNSKITRLPPIVLIQLQKISRLLEFLRRLSNLNVITFVVDANKSISSSGSLYLKCREGFLTIFFFFWEMAVDVPVRMGEKCETWRRMCLYKVLVSISRRKRSSKSVVVDPQLV